MGSFSYISATNKEQFDEKYGLFNTLGNKFRDFLIPVLPDYVYDTVGDMGITKSLVSAEIIFVPGIDMDKALMKKKFLRAIKKLQHKGKDVVILDKSTDPEWKVENQFRRIKFSRGIIYPPVVFIEAAKKLSALMGIDFNRSNICIIDALTQMGGILTELLQRECMYLTLCTRNKDEIIKKINHYILQSGLSPAIMTNYKKAAANCDILFYTGGIELDEVLEYTFKKMLIVNLTQQKITIKKDLPIIDEIVLQTDKMPLCNRQNKFKTSFLTSRMWEGALLTLTDIDALKFSLQNVAKINEIAQKQQVKISGVIINGKISDESAIYRYR